MEAEEGRWLSRSCCRSLVKCFLLWDHCVQIVQSDCCVFIESHLKERVDDSMTLPSSYETLVARTELAAVSHLLPLNTFISVWDLGVLFCH